MPRVLTSTTHNTVLPTGYHRSVVYLELAASLPLSRRVNATRLDRTKVSKRHPPHSVGYREWQVVQAQEEAMVNSHLDEGAVCTGGVLGALFWLTHHNTTFGYCSLTFLMWTILPFFLRNSKR